MGEVDVAVVSTPTVTPVGSGCAMVVMAISLVVGWMARAGRVGGQHCDGSVGTGFYQVTLARLAAPGGWPRRRADRSAQGHEAGGPLGSGPDRGHRRDHRSGPWTGSPPSSGGPPASATTPPMSGGCWAGWAGVSSAPPAAPPNATRRRSANGRRRLAQDQKNARRRKAAIVVFDESGVSLTPAVRSTWAPKGHTPVICHRFNWERVSMAAALCYGSHVVAADWPCTSSAAATTPTS